MSVAAAVTANLLYVPRYFCYYPPPLPIYRKFFLYDSRTFGSPPTRRFDVCVSSLGKSRKKKKSDSELCEEIGEFLESAGLPEDHVPSIKELSEHGRNDLANLVRRRGYKVIKEILLANRVGTYAGKDNLAKNKENGSHHAEIVKGNVEDNLLRKTGLDLSFNMVSSRRDITVSSDESSFKDKTPRDWGDGNDILLPFEASEKEEYFGSFNQDVAFSHTSRLPEEISIDETHKGVTEISSSASTGISFPLENLSGHSQSHTESDKEISNRKYVGSSIKSSLHERVAKLMQSGYLDPLEDCLSDILTDHYKEENKTPAVQKNGPEYVMDGQLKTPMKELPRNMSGEGLVELNGINARDQQTDKETFDGNLKSEGGEESPRQEKPSEVKHLKLMLHQKELELSQLKEEIQKEKNALELMQIKAENEIGKAQERIWEKDAELQTAEDSLAGLKEVQIEYQGEGDTVELAGSFNGWQSRITMDPQTSDGSRKHSLWSTTLWLYPGKYEIKFVIDGNWKIDLQKESITRGSISNNILRVER